MFDSDSPFYTHPQEITIDSFLQTKNDEVGTETDLCDCGGEFKDKELNGLIYKICKSCGCLVKTDEVVERISISKKNITSSGGFPMVSITRKGTTVFKRTYYSNFNNGRHKKKVINDTISYIFENCKKKGIKIDPKIPIIALKYFSKINITRARIRKGVIAECIIQAYKDCGKTCNKKTVLDIMGIDSLYLSKGEKIVTRYIKPFNITDWDQKIKKDVFRMLNHMNMYSVKRHLFALNLVRYCDQTYIAIHSGDRAKCMGAIFLICQMENRMSIREFSRKQSITNNTVLTFVDQVKITLWRKPEPDTKLYPDRFTRMAMRRKNLRLIFTKHGYDIPPIINKGRFTKYFAQYNIES
jgi:transcription initiation factor TFIIIB Brf1 subunit/transcription initiation factor TFIIB